MELVKDVMIIPELKTKEKNVDLINAIRSRRSSLMEHVKIVIY